MVLRKTVGEWKIYERVPKPADQTRYCAVRQVVGQAHLMDFGRYAKAVRWAKGQK